MLLPYNHKLIVFFCRQITHTNENQTIGFSLERGNAYLLNGNKHPTTQQNLCLTTGLVNPWYEFETIKHTEATRKIVM